jgi:hypothetical protein
MEKGEAGEVVARSARSATGDSDPETLISKSSFANGELKLKNEANNRTQSMHTSLQHLHVYS